LEGGAVLIYFGLLYWVVVWAEADATVEAVDLEEASVAAEVVVASADLAEVALVVEARVEAGRFVVSCWLFVTLRSYNVILTT